MNPMAFTTNSSLAYDDSRIASFPDKFLLAKLRDYFHKFTSGDFDGMRDIESEDYTMTDIPLGVIGAPRPAWYEINKTFTGMLADLKVTAISVDGSAAPGMFSVLEHWVEFKIKVDPPPESAKHLPQGAKAGDTLGMINVSVLWWGATGLITRELEYGRLTWPGFDLAEFDKRKEEKRKALLAKL